MSGLGTNGLRLVLVEGLPKTGKSSVSDLVAATLGCRRFAESELPHPIDIGWPTDRAAAVSGCRLATYPFHLWEQFVASLDQATRPIVMEARLCQNAACFALTAGASADEATELSAKIASIVASVDPLVLYLRPADAQGHVTSILDFFDETSRNYLSELFDGLPFALHRGLSGENAFTETMAAWAPLIERVMGEIRTRCGIEVVAIEDPHRDWRFTNAAVLDVIAARRSR